MKKLIFATNNKNKLFEASELLKDYVEIVSLENININEDIPEDFETLEKNARQKSSFVYDITKMNCFSDDTGLEVEALNNKPGVYSARFASMEKNNPGIEGDGKENMNYLLQLMDGLKNRKARFRTAINLIWEEKHYLFEGIVNGTIAEKPKGEKGFGYDPVFIPDNYNNTFAQMDISLKNKISHRAIALNNLFSFIKSQ